jgi:Phage capsid protein
MVFVPQGEMFSLDTSQVFIPERWLTDIIRRRDENLILANYVMKINDFKQPGDLIRKPRISDLGVNNKSLKTPVTYQAVTETDWTMRVTRYKESSIMIEDILKDRAHTNLQSEYTTRCSFALARDIDYALLAERAAIIGASSDSHLVSTDPISLAEIMAAKEILLRRRIPEPYTLLVGIGHMASLWNIEEFKNRLYTDANVLATGKVSSILGVDIVMTNNLQQNSATGLFNGENDPTPSPTPGMAGSLYYPDQEDGTVTPLTAGYTSGMMIASDCIALAMEQVPRMETARDIDYQATKVVTTQRYGVKLYRELDGVVISTDEDAAV